MDTQEHAICHVWIHLFPTSYTRGEKPFGLELESNPGPLASQATALTTRPCHLGQVLNWVLLIFFIKLLSSAHTNFILSDSNPGLQMLWADLTTQPRNHFWRLSILEKLNLKQVFVEFCFLCRFLFFNTFAKLIQSFFMKSHLVLFSPPASKSARSWCHRSLTTPAIFCFYFSQHPTHFRRMRKK